jgi:hypothetical protein
MYKHGKSKNASREYQESEGDEQGQLDSAIRIMPEIEVSQDHRSRRGQE